MDRKKLYIYGGIGAAVLVGGYLLLGRGSSQQASSGDASYYPPMVYGGASTPVTADSAGTGATTDSSIAQILAQNLSIATMQNNLSMAQLSNDKDIALAGYANDLAKTKLQTSASVEASLASQLGNIVSNMVGTKTKGSSSSGFLGIGGGSSQNTQREGLSSVTGHIGYNADTGDIAFDVAKNTSPQLNGQVIPPFNH